MRASVGEGGRCEIEGERFKQTMIERGREGEARYLVYQLWLNRGCVGYLSFAVCISKKHDKRISILVHCVGRIEGAFLLSLAQHVFTT